MSVENIIEELSKIPKITGVIVYDFQEKNVLKSSLEEGNEKIINMINNNLSLKEKVGVFINTEKLNEIYVQTPKQDYIFDIVMGKFVVCLAAESGVNLGKVKLELKKTRDFFEKNLV